MKKLIITSLIITSLFAGFYETPDIWVGQFVSAGGTYEDTFNMANRSLFIQDVSWIPQATGVRVRYTTSGDVDITLIHNNLAFSYTDPGTENWFYTNIWVGQRANGLWILRFQPSANEWFERWTLRIAFIPTADIVNPVTGGFLKGVFPFMVNTTGTQYARLFLEDVNTGNKWIVLNWTQNPSDPDGTIDWQVLQSYDTRGLPDGRYIFVAEVIDNENILKADTVTGIKIDNTSPVVGPYDPLPGDYLTGTVNLIVNAYDNFGVFKVQYSVDGDTPVDMTLVGSNYQASLNTTLYEEGPHTITYVVTDSAGNVSTYDLNVYFDNTAPTGIVIAPDENAFISGESTIQVQANDNLEVDSVAITFGGVLSSLGTKSATYNSLTGYWEYLVNTALYQDGRAWIDVVIFDKAGLSYNVATRNFWVDNNPPTLQVLNPQENFYLTGNVILKIISTDGVGVPDYSNNPLFRVDGGTYYDMARVGTTDTFTASLNTTNFTDGLHSFEFTVRDSAGRVTSVTVNAYIDNTSPAVSIVSPTGGEYISGAYTFKASGSDNLAVDKVYLIFGGVLSSLGTKEAVYNSSSGYYEYIVETGTFPEGSADVRAVIYDKAGHVDTSQVVSFYVDNALPNLQALFPIEGNYLRGVQEFKVLAYDNSGIQAVYYSIDNGSFISMANTSGDTFSANINTSDFEDGIHKITYKAVAVTGAWDTVSINVYFDNTSPTISIVSPNDSAYVKGGFIFSSSGYDNLKIKRVEYEFSGVLSSIGRVVAQYNSATGYYEYFVNTPDYSDGIAGIKAVIYDEANAKDSVSVSFIVDNTPPSVSIEIQGANADTIYPDSVYTVRIVSSEVLSELPSLYFYPVGYDTVPLQVTGTVPGTLFTAQLKVDGSTGDVKCQFLYSGKDLAGNVGTNIISGEWFYINTLAPILSFTPPTEWEAFDDIVFKVTAHGTRVQKIYLYYKSHFGTDYKVKEFAGQNPYTVKIPGSEVTIDGIDYYIEAVSEENTITRIASADNPNYIKVIAHLGNGETYDDGVIYVKVPAGAFSDNSEIGISRPFTAPTPPDSLPYTGIFFEIIPPGSQPNVPVTFEVRYSEDVVQGMNEDELNLLNTNDWSPVDRESVSSTENVYRTRFSTFASDTTTYALCEYYNVKAKELLPSSYVYFAPNPVKNTNTAYLFFYLNPAKQTPREVIIKIYDISGDLVEIKRIRNPLPGINKVKWNIVQIPRGIYIFRVQAGGEEVIKKIAVIK